LPITTRLTADLTWILVLCCADWPRARVESDVRQHPVEAVGWPKATADALTTSDACPLATEVAKFLW